LTKAVDRARVRAKRRGLPFDLDFADLEGLWQVQDGHCAISGIAFHDLRFDEAFVKYPFAPSLDRVVPTKGYVSGNVRLVCTAANFARNEWGDDVLRQVAHGIVANERAQEREWFHKQQLKVRRAERAMEGMTGESLRRQERVIAGLKAALKKGPARLRGASHRARNSQSKQRS